MWSKIERLDPRIIYGLLVLAILVPLMTPLGIPIEVMPMTMQGFKAIDSLKDGARVMLSHDYSFGTQPELEPIMKAFLKHLARKNAKVYAVASVVDGPMLAASTLKTYESLGKKYGTDFMNVGYFAGGEAGMAAMAKDFRSVFRTDFYGTSLDKIEMMKDVKDIRSFDLVISGNAGPVGGGSIDVWVRQTVVPYKTQFMVCVTAIMIPTEMPYVQAGQVVALVGGLRGGAEYESLIKSAGDATLAMGAQSSTHFMILALILLGNIAFWVNKRSKGV